MTEFRDAWPSNATHPAGMPFPPTKQLKGQTTMRTKLPPQPSPFDADFVNRACSRYEMPPIDPERLSIEVECAELDYELPIAGLGFELEGLNWQPVDGTCDWTRPFTRRPWVDVGLRFDGEPEDSLNGLASLLDFYKHGGRGVRLPDGGILSERYGMPRPEHAWLLPLLPVVWLPAADAPWVSAENLSTLLGSLQSGCIEPRELVSPLVLRACLEHPRPAPQRYRHPRRSGDVTRADVDHFFGYVFKTLAGAMCALLGWDDDDMAATAPAKEANALARRVLGIRVDLRVGCLLDETEISQAECIVHSPRWIGDVALADRLFPHLESNLRRVSVPAPTGEHNMLDGAAWSCDVARLMSAPEIWGIAPSRSARPARAPAMVHCYDVESVY